MTFSAFRVIHQDSRATPLSAYVAPGRYHRTPEEARSTSYLAFSLETCKREVAYHLGGTVRLRDRIAIEFEIDVEKVLDLTLSRERKKLGVDLDDLTGDYDLTLTQGIAGRMRKRGVQALVVPSARDPKGRNLVLFLENIGQESVREVGEEKLE